MVQLDKLVRCPNYCISGQVKFYQDPNKALFTLVKCKYCKGKGYVSKEDAERIDKEI